MGAKDPTLRAAEGYAALLKWPVFPVAGKVPITPHGFKDASTDPAVIRAAWRPGCNVAVALVPGLVVVDVDAGHGGYESLRQLEAQHGDLPATVVARTGGGGLHMFYKVDPKVVIPNRPMAPGIDIKASGGYIVAPPSMHASGRRYEWARRPVEHEVADAPVWLVERIEAKPLPPVQPMPRGKVGRDVIERARRYVAAMPPAISGQGGHAATFAVALVLARGFALPEHLAMEIMCEFNLRCDPAWSIRELRHKLISAHNQSRAEVGYLLGTEVAA